MPVPVYSICADTFVEDKRTNKSSLFNIFDKVIVTRLPQQALDKPKHGDDVSLISMNAAIVTVWMMDDSDYGAEFECQLAIVSPSKTAFQLDLPHITMPSDRTKRFHRQVLQLGSMPPLFENGIWHFETRIRKVGVSGEWLVQCSPFEVALQETSPTQPP